MYASSDGEVQIYEAQYTDDDTHCDKIIEGAHISAKLAPYNDKFFCCLFFFNKSSLNSVINISPLSLRLRHVM